MQQSLNLTIPKAWQELTDKQLRFVFRLLAGNYSLPQIKTLCLMKWAKLRVLRREGAVFIIEYQGNTYPVTALQITEATTTMTWLDGVPGYPVRLSRIGLHRPVRADFQDVSFGDFLILDNLYQGYLQTKRSDLLVETLTEELREMGIIPAAIENAHRNLLYASQKALITSSSPHVISSGLTSSWSSLSQNTRSPYFIIADVI